MGVRETILTAALDCFTEDGYERTTIARICERSGVSNGALFHYFRTKEAIAGALYLDAIRSVQDGYWKVLALRPETLEDAVAGVIRQQLTWIEANPDRARFLYSQGRLDWATDAGGQLKALNDDLGSAYRDWLAPFVARGQARDLPMMLVVAIVTGPAHAVARHWLAGQLTGSLLDHLDDLAAAAAAGLSGAPAALPARPRRPAIGRVRIQVLGNDGAVIAEGDAVAELTGP